jgi:spermidine/putrescine transport system ATP-binding protein
MLKPVGERSGSDAERSTGNAAVVLESVSKSFRGPTGLKTVVDELSLVIKAGEFFSLLGPSGCGKTTTLRLIAGLEQVDSGRIILGGKDSTGLAAHSRNVNTVFQNYALFPHLNVFDNVAYGLRRQHVGGPDLRRRVRESLELVHMDGYMFHKPQQLSGGQQQRIALARALVNEPTVLLLDEPLAALDLKLRESMQEELKRLQRELKLTFLFVTHDQAEAFAMSDRVGVMEGGKLVQVGTPQELYLHPANHFVATFVGRANFIPLSLVEGGSPSNLAGVATRRLEPESPETLTADASSIGPRPRGISGTKIFVRPERLHLILKTESATANGPRVRGTIVDKTFAGGMTTVRLSLGSHVEVFATCDSASDEVRDAEIGESAYVSWRADDATVIE